MKGHRDLNATACPGRYLYADLPDIVEQARVYYGSEEMQAERQRIAQHEREEEDLRRERLRAQIEEVQRKNGMARPSHPAPSTPNPPVQPPPKKAELRPNKRPDLPKPPPQPRPEQRRIAT